MTVLNDLVKSADTGLTGTDYKFVDADTIVDPSGQRYRIQGIDAPEVEKYVKDEYHLGTAGGEVASETLRKLANDFGFTNVKPVLGEDGEPELDPHGRPVIDLVNDEGQSFRSKILETGVLETTRYTTNTDRLTAELGQLDRERSVLYGLEKEDTAWDQARNTIQEAMRNEGAKQQGFREAALDEFELATAEGLGFGHIFAGSNVQVRDYDRNIKNESNNPLSDAWDVGIIGVQEAMWGITNLLGETTNNQFLSEVGEAGVERAQTRIKDRGTIITSYEDVDSFADAMEFVGTNAAISLPYMALSIAGVAATPLIGTGAVATAAGVGLVSAPAAVYAGQTWNEMEGEKNAGVAVASGVLQAAFDRLGIATIFKAGAPPKKLFNDGVQALMAKGMSKEQATKAVSNATRKELAGFAGDAAKVAKQQLAAKNQFKQLATRLAAGTGGEGLTEVAQEATAYTAAVHGSSKEWDWNQFNNRITNALVAGSALGGAFSVPGAAIDAGAWADVAYRTAPAEEKRLSDAGRWAEQEVKEHGRVSSIRELNEETGRIVAARGNNIVPLEERVEADRSRRRNRTFEDKITETALATPSLWRGTIRHIIPQHVKDQSRAARKMADIFGGQLQKTFSGASYENEKFHRVAIYKNMVDLPERVFASFNDGKIPTAKRKKEISDGVYTVLQNSVDKNGNFDPSLVPEGPHRQAIISLQAQLQRLSDKMYTDQKKFNPDLGHINNYLSRYKAFDKQTISKNKEAFVQALLNKKEYAGTRAEAIALADEIINNAEVNDFGEAFSAVKGEFKPPSHQERTLNLAEDPEFAQFMERDLFANVSNAVRSAARYTTHQDYVGSNGEKVAALLDEMQSEGVDADTVNKIAAGMQDFLDAEAGNYKRAQSRTGKQLENIQKSFMFVTMLAGLPLATISSFVELALSMRGLTNDQIFGKGGLKTVGKEFADTLSLGIDRVGSWRPGAKYKDKPVSYGKHNLRQLGFYEWDVGAATVTGATEIRPIRQAITEKFFLVTGLSGWTNYTRAIRASIGADYILDKINTILETDPENPTNESQEAQEALRNIGVNVDDMVNFEIATMTGQVTPEMEKQFEENIREGMFNFINDAVALPQSANRPLIYQDPRFALFTQFQGFIATFTANHIPKLWGEYVKRGTPAMKYNAFAIMTTMIALGFASQYLKDLIKYQTGDNPYLEDPEYIQRGIRASGLLGTGERLLDQFAPIYETRNKNPIDWVYNQTTGEAPALGNVARLAKGAGKAAEGEFEAGLYNALKSTPIVGPLTNLNKAAASLVTTGDWNYNGER